MKKFTWIFLSVLLTTNCLKAQQMPGKPTQPSLNKAPFAKPAQPPTHEAPPIHKRELPPPAKAKITSVPFTLPGIVGIANGQWGGSDNLFNLKPNIGIYVEIVIPEGKKFDVTEVELGTLVTDLFVKAGISPYALQEPESPPLPLFHVLIMINSIGQNVFASCSCRLFESVTLKRVILERGITYQAITWEKQDLISAVTNDFKGTLQKTIEELTSEFTTRFHYFQNFKSQSQSQ